MIVGYITVGFGNEGNESSIGVYIYMSLKSRVRGEPVR